MPGPDCRQDIIDDADAGLPGFFDEAHVKSGIIDADQYVRLFFFHRIEEKIPKTKEKRNLADDFPDADKSQVLDIIYNAYTGIGHAGAAHTQKFHFRIQFFQRPGQIGTMHIARCFTG